MTLSTSGCRPEYIRFAQHKLREGSWVLKMQEFESEVTHCENNGLCYNYCTCDYYFYGGYNVIKSTTKIRRRHKG